MKKTVIIEVICFLFIVLFMYAAIIKLLDYEKFKAQIGQSPLLTAFSGWVVWVVPMIEIVLALLLMTQRFRLMALYGAFNLMIIFTAYIVAILQFSEYVPCSCGGVLTRLGWTEHLIFNMFFVLLGLMGIILVSKQNTKEIVSA